MKTNQEMKTILLRNYTAEDLVELWIEEMSEDRKNLFIQEDQDLAADRAEVEAQSETKN